MAIYSLLVLSVGASSNLSPIQGAHVPVTGGRLYDGNNKGGGGLVEVGGSVVWGGRGAVFKLEETGEWRKTAKELTNGARLALYGERLGAVGGWKDGVSCSTVVVWEGRSWYAVSEMLKGCACSCVLGIGGGSLVVMGGISVSWKYLNDVQVFDGKRWQKGPPLPQPCAAMSAVVHGDQIYIIGGGGMDRKVWSANIRHLHSYIEGTAQAIWKKLPDVPYFGSSVCVVDDELLAIGGAEDQKGEKRTSAIHVLREQKWHHIGDLPFKCSYVDVLMMSDRKMLVVDGYSQRVVACKPKPHERSIMLGNDVIKSFEKKFLTASENVKLPAKKTSGQSTLNAKTDDTDRRLYEEAMTKGYVETSITKCLIIGAAGVGKTHLKHLLLNKSPPQQRVSTGLADNPVRAISLTRGSSVEDNWTVVENDRELISIIGEVIKGGVSMETSLAEVVKNLPKMPKDTPNVAVSDGPAVGPTPSCVNTAKEPDQSTALEVVEDMIHHINKSSGNKKLFGVKWIHFIDSGGQLQYHDILPLFIQNPMVTIFVMKLSDKLSDHPSIEYYGADGMLVSKAQSPLSHLWILLNCLRAMYSQNAHPSMIIIVGTHRDLQSNCPESQKEKNKLLLSILNNDQFHILYNGESVKNMIFPINGLAPVEEDKYNACKIRNMIISESPQDSTKTPIAWFGLEIALRKLSHGGVLSLNECEMHASKMFCIQKDAFSAALHHLIHHNVFLHYPEVLPQTVFTDPQVVLTKVTELVQHCHKLINNPDDNTVAKGSQVVRFRDHGVLSLELLKKFPKHYHEGLFTPQNLLKLLVSRGAIAKIREGEYLIPALLPYLDSSQMSKYYEKGTSLMIQFTHGYIPSGLYCCVVAHLLSSSWKVCMNGDKPGCLYRNCVKLGHKDTPDILTLIDMFTSMKLCVQEPSTSDCRKIKACIHSCISQACSVLKYSDVQMKDAFLCTGSHCRSHPPHVAIVTSIGSLYKWKCTVIEDQIGDLSMEQLVWFEQSHSEAEVSKSVEETISSGISESFQLSTTSTVVSRSSQPAGLPVITVQPQSLVASWGKACQLSCRADGLSEQKISYQWYMYKGRSWVPVGKGEDLRREGVTCEDEGRYYCEVSSGVHKVMSEEIIITAQLDEADIIDITMQPKDKNVRANNSITLTCEASNQSGKELAYEWFEGKKKVAHGPTYIPDTHVKNYKTMHVYCQVSLKGKGNVFVKSREVRVTISPVWIKVQPQSVTECVGRPMVLYCHAEGISPNVTYDWLKSVKEDGPFDYCSSGEVFIVESLSYNDNGYYKCQVNGVIMSDTVCIKTKLHHDCDREGIPHQICFKRHLHSWAIELGKPLSLKCDATSCHGEVSYQWIKDRRILVKETSNVLSRNTASANDLGSYYCLVKTKEGDIALSNKATVVLRSHEPVFSSGSTYKTDEGHFAQEKIALLIGNGHYTKLSILEKVEMDIKKIQAVLKKLDFKVISLLDLTYDEMTIALDEFYKLLGPGIYAVIYYSGHGFKHSDITYLMPIDASETPLLCDQNISAKTIRCKIQSTSATGLSLLDCCAVSAESQIQSPKCHYLPHHNSHNYCEISACPEGHCAYMHRFSDALVQCLEKKIAVNDLCQEILNAMKKSSDGQHPQVPFPSGMTLDKVSLHDPIMFSSEDAEKKSDLICGQCAKANNVPENFILYKDVHFEHSKFTIKLQVHLTAEFSNVLNVKVCPVPDHNIITTIKAYVNRPFMGKQGILCFYDDGTESFKLIGLQRIKNLLTLCLTVTVEPVAGSIRELEIIHEFESKVLFGSFLHA